MRSFDWWKPTIKSMKHNSEKISFWKILSNILLNTYIWEKLGLRYNCMWKMFVWEFWLWLFITFRREEILSETWFKSLDCADCYTLKANSSFPPWIQSENIFAIRRPSPEKNLFFQALPKLPAVKRAKPSLTDRNWKDLNILEKFTKNLFLWKDFGGKSEKERKATCELCTRIYILYSTFFDRQRWTYEWSDKLVRRLVVHHLIG